MTQKTAATRGKGRARPDPVRVETFAGRMVEALNGAALSLACSVGHRTGLFDVMAALPPSTSRRIAATAALHERYVREWLAAVTAAGVVEYDAAAGTYALPAEHAAVLTPRSRRNFAVTAQFIPMLAAAEDRIVECFRHGGGVEPEAFARLHDVVAEESRRTVVAALFDLILPLAPELTARLTEGIEALDVGCGKGRAVIALASAFPNSRFLGIDVSGEAVAAARAEAAELELRNARFEQRDAEGGLPPADLVTAFHVIHDQRRPGETLRGIRRALRPHGVFLMQEVHAASELAANLRHPAGPFLYTLSYNHCLALSMARGGDGLGACWGRERAMAMLREAGFAEVSVHPLPHDLLNELYVARPGSGPPGPPSG